MVQGVPLRGVHPTIKSTFFPNYSYEAAAYEKEVNPSSMNDSMSACNIGKGKKKATRMRPGIHAGLLVDREMKRTVNLQNKYNIPVETFTSSQAKKMYITHRGFELSDSDIKLFKQRCSTATTLIWQTLHRLKLTPFTTQLPVACRFLNVATAADLICRDTNNKFVIVEVKTGFTHYYHRHTKHNLMYITPPQTDSPCHQYQLQLALTYELYRRTFPSNPVASAFVLRVDGFGVELTPLQKWTKDNFGRIIQAVKSDQIQQQQQITKDINIKRNS